MQSTLGIAELIDQLSSGKNWLLEGLHSWEKRRLAYNICVGVSGLLSMVVFGFPLDLYTLIGIGFYGVLANICYMTDRYPQVPWRAVKTFRNFIVHEYFGVDYIAMWNTVQDDLPV